MSNAWHVRIGGWLCFSALALGCGDSGSETPNPGDGVGDADGAGDGSGDGSGDADGSGADGEGSADGAPDGSNDGDGGDGSALAGEYWMRSDIDASLSEPSVGAMISSKITAYSLVRVSAEDGELVMTDWQCHVTTEQSCVQGCEAASTSARDGETRAYAPSRRMLTVSGGAWSTNQCAAAVGWTWDCAEGGEPDLPEDADDDRIYNPAGGQPGVDISASVTSLLTFPCEANVVQVVDLSYEGTLSEGKLSTGVVQDHGSDQTVIGGSCGSVPDPVPTGPGTLRMVPAQSPIAGGDDWECPSLAEFQQALPNP